jgi:hypothetical protein
MKSTKSLDDRPPTDPSGIRSFQQAKLPQQLLCRLSWGEMDEMLGYQPNQPLNLPEKPKQPLSRNNKHCSAEGIKHSDGERPTLLTTSRRRVKYRVSTHQLTESSRKEIDCAEDRDNSAGNCTRD